MGLQNRDRIIVFLSKLQTLRSTYFSASYYNTGLEPCLLQFCELLTPYKTGRTAHVSAATRS